MKTGLFYKACTAVIYENPDLKTDDRPPRALWMKLGFGGLVIILTGVMLFVLSEPLSYPENISVSNVSSASITLSWTTDGPDETKVVLTEANLSQYLPFFFYRTIGDDRDRESGFNPKRNVHYLTLKDLKPSTRYIARIYSGLRQVHTQKLTTGPIINLPEPNLVYGKLLNGDQTAASGIPVYLRLVSKEGSSSALLSSLTNEKGSWSIEASNARIRNLGRAFNGRGVSYETLVVDDGMGNRFKATTIPGKDKPWPNIVLQASPSGGLKNE